MSNASDGSNGAAGRFDTFSSLNESNSELLKRERWEKADARFLDDVEVFIRRASATGALLDALNERDAAQGQLDYWVTVLYQARRTPPDAALAHFDPSLSPVLDDSKCPYRGLSAFHERDKDNFFGRRRLVEQLVERLATRRFLFVVGPSGSGKSSLVMAGLLPALKSGALPGSEDWQVFPRLVPGANPLKNLAAALGRVYQMPAAWTRELAQKLRAHPTLLPEVVAERGGAPAVLVVDQFEEVFTLCDDKVARDAFVSNLVALARSEGPRHTVLLTLRADYETYLAQSEALMELFDEGEFRVLPLMAADLRDAIEEPARRVGLKLEEGVTDELVKDILGEPAALPLLQYTLLQLWKTREDGRNRITMRQYRRLGGARQALSKAADEFYRNLPHEERQTARRIMLRLVRPSGNEEVMSNRVRRETLTFEDGDRIDRVLAKLVDAGLVQITKGDTPAQNQIEVAHEALARNWETLGEWVEKERINLRQRLRLTAAAEYWLEHSRDAGGLLGGSLLEDALKYDDLNELEREFVDASKEAARRAEREKEEARQREQQLEHEKMLALEAEAAALQAKADALQAKADQEARSAHRLRRYMYGLAALALVAVGFAVAAGIATARARESHARAVESEDFAKKEQGRATEGERKALEQAKLAEERRKEAVAATKMADEERQKAVAESRRAQEQADLAAKRLKDAQAAEARAVEAHARAERLAKEKADRIDLMRTTATEHYRTVALLNSGLTYPAVRSFESLLTNYQDIDDQIGEVTNLGYLSRGYTKLSVEDEQQGKKKRAAERRQQARKFYEQAEQMLERNIAAKVATAETDFKGAVDAYEDLARFYSEFGSDDKVEQTYVRALDMQVKAIKKKDDYGRMRYDDMFRRLVQLYEEQGGARDDELRQLYEMNINAQKAFEGGAESFAVSAAFDLLAAFHLRRRNFDEAERLYSESLNLVQRIIEQRQNLLDREQLVISLNNLGDVYKEKGDHAEAEKYYLKGLPELEKLTPVLEWVSGTAGRTYTNLAEVHMARNQPVEAIEAYAASVELYRVDTSGNVEKVLQTLVQLGALYSKQGNYQGAEGAFTQAAKIIETEGEAVDNWLRAQVFVELAKVRFESSKRAQPEEAQRLLQAAVADFYRALIARPDLFDSRLNFIPLLTVNVPATTVTFYEQLLALQKQKILAGDPKDAHARLSQAERIIRELGAIYKAAGRLDDEIAVQESALEIRRKVYGTPSQHVYKALNGLGLLYERKRDYAKAEEMYDAALRLVEELYHSTSDRPYVIDSLNALARARGHLRKFEESESLYLRAIANLQKGDDANSNAMADTRTNYAGLLRLMGREAEAAAQLELAAQIKGARGAGATPPPSR